MHKKQAVDGDYIDLTKRGDYKVLTVPIKSFNLENVVCKTVRIGREMIKNFASFEFRKRHKFARLIGLKY